MPTTQIPDALPGESLLAIEPALLQKTTAGWLQRLAMFTGRTLSDTALTNEQAYRAGHLTLLGQSVTQGTVQGLELSVDSTAADPILTLSPGYGIAASGQDVTLVRPLRTTLSSLAVLDGDTGNRVADFKNFTAPAAAWAGIFLLQPIVAELAGSALDTGTSNLIVSGNLAASCDQDPTEDAFDDSQIVDGARLVLVTWPTAPASLALPAPTPGTTWRNRIAYTIFNAELAVNADTFLPWEFYGTPLALVAFDDSSKILFTDRSSVVRVGGLPRRRYLRPFQNNIASVQSALANARVNQFAEQLGESLTPATLPGLVSNQFDLLPPAGVLPAYTMDFPNHRALWCPSNWSVQVAPTFSEELEGEIQRAMTAAPLDTSQNEAIEILVPLPDEVFDPNILLTETVSPEFQAEIDAATLTRNIILQHRYIIEQEINTLAPLLNQSPIDLEDGLTEEEVAELTAAQVFSPLASEDFGTTFAAGTYTADDLQSLQQTAAAAPYTVSANGISIPLFNQDDWNDLTTNGVQHFIDRINTKLKTANDLLDLSFLTAQTDIYRYRQNVLNTTAASRLAVSPILANIASGDTAAATAQNIRDYLASIAPVAPPTNLTLSPSSTAGSGSSGGGKAVEFRNTNPRAKATFLNAPSVLVNPSPFVVSPASNIGSSVLTKEVSINTNLVKGTTAFTPINFQDTPATPVDITQQAPVVGAQLNLRTLTIAERLAPSPAQEAMFYSIGNRVAALELLSDLEITVDDLPILVDNLPAETPAFVVADIRSNAARRDQVFELVNNPQITTPASQNPDEPTAFSTGIHVVDQNTQLLRGVEARIQQYQDFLALAAEALGRVQSNMAAAQSLLMQLNNDLTSARQNMAFVQALLNDEQARVNTVNAQRASVLSQYVTYVAYVRPRTVIVKEEAPSRQLVPANVSSPVPGCINQTVAVPPELREIVSLLREAPVRWFPPILTLLPKLERPALLQNLAVSSQTRASLALQTPAPTSSAESATGGFASAISGIFSTNLQTIRSIQVSRAGFNVASLGSQSWSSQVSTVGNMAAIGDVIGSSIVHPEITAAASTSLQQISNVATCLYTRVGQVLPVDRLEWANFIDDGNINLRNLAVLPGWNTQNYVDRQQMQLIVDWLYQQIDTNDSTAVSLMNDLIATAILLASQAPVDDIIAGAISLRTIPVVGNPIRLTLPSDRIGHGMSVQLYSGGALAARAVVTDLDGGGVSATVTDVYKPDVALETNDVAHFTGLNQNAVIYRAFSK